MKPHAAAEPVAALRHVQARVRMRPSVMMVLGSGLGELADEIEDAVHIPYGEIPGFAPARVEGHRGRLVAGRLEGIDCIVAQGRYHLYEGHSARSAALPVRVMAALGARTLLVTNAAGAVNRAFRAGDLMLIDDHINFLWRNPLIGPVAEGEPRFPDLSQPYSAELQDLASRAALELGFPLRRGVYCALLGPSYETPAEIRMMQRLGADAVGMSTVPEVLVALSLGVAVLGISLITNPAAGLSVGPLSHDEVVRSAALARDAFGRLVRTLLREPAFARRRGAP